METGWGEAQTVNALGRRRAKFTWKAADSPQKGRAFLVPGPGSTLGHCWDLGLEDPPHIQSKQPAPQSLPALLPAPFFLQEGLNELLGAEQGPPSVARKGKGHRAACLGNQQPWDPIS